MTCARVTVYRHAFVESSPIYQYLESLLPHSIAIFRRITHKVRSRDAVLLATFSHAQIPRANDAFVVFFFDPAEPRGIDGWLFTSAELGARLESARSIDHHLVAILQHARTHWAPEAGVYKDATIKVGAIHAETAAALHRLGSKDKVAQSIIRDDTYGPGGPFRKHIFTSHAACWGELRLPSDFEFDVARPDELANVVANNPYVNTSQLAEMRNVGIREDASQKLVAWAFQGLDGGVRTVFCLPEYRRRHLAHAVVSRLVQDDVETWGPKSDEEYDEDRLQHVDIVAGNKASLKLFESLGAEFAWDAYWLRLDLDRLPR